MKRDWGWGKVVLFIIGMVVIATIGIATYANVAANCDGVVVKDYAGFPACVEMAP